MPKPKPINPEDLATLHGAIHVLRPGDRVRFLAACVRGPRNDPELLLRELGNDRVAQLDELGWTHACRNCKRQLDDLVAQGWVADAGPQSVSPDAS